MLGGEIQVWNTASWKLVARLSGHGSYVTSLAFLDRPEEGVWLVSGSDDETVRVWDPKRSAEVRCLQGHSHSVTGVVPTARGNANRDWLIAGDSAFIRSGCLEQDGGRNAACRRRSDFTFEASKGELAAPSGLKSSTSVNFRVCYCCAGRSRD
jgi:WD40 repeat protein